MEQLDPSNQSRMDPQTYLLNLANNHIGIAFSVLSLGVGGWIKVEIKAISAQPTEVGVGLSWAELGNILPPGRSMNEL